MAAARKAPWWEHLPDEELLDVRLCDLELRIEGTAIEERLARLYAELERVAVLLGDPQPDAASRDVPRGRWSYHPGGYFIRFFPRGYNQTLVQVHVPETTAASPATEAHGEPGFLFASRAEAPVLSAAGPPARRATDASPAGTVRVDLSEVVAVPAARGRQRLAISGRER